MMYILTVIFVSLIILGLIMVASMWYMKWISKLIFGNKHVMLERITSMQAIPEEWTTKYNNRLHTLQQRKRINESRKLQDKACRTYLRRLKGLSNYVKKTSLVENEETRNLTLQLLNRVRMEWEERLQNGYIS